jgi:hypothetical protein
MKLGLDITEVEFEIENDRINAEIISDPDFDDDNFTTYALKNCPTEKGFWMEILSGYEKYFSQAQIESGVPYTPIEEETIEL